MFMKLLGFLNKQHNRMKPCTTELNFYQLILCYIPLVRGFFTRL